MPQLCHFKKLLAMSLKTARAWLDAHNFVMADAAIVHGWEQTERILKCVAGDQEGTAVVSASKVNTNRANLPPGDRKYVLKNIPVIRTYRL